MDLTAIESVHEIIYC